MELRAGDVVPPDDRRDGAAELGHGTSYVYSHDQPYGLAAQQYAPDVVADAEYYQPTSLGAEGRSANPCTK